MDIIVKTLIWGTITGIIHFVAVGILYQNPLAAKIYKNAAEHPGLKKWENKKKYILCMFLGTQLEVYIISVSYIFLISILGKSFIHTLILGLIIAGIRVYPRFWNMWIQSSYPNTLLAVEAINGTIGSFVIVFILFILPT